jgi:O-antigen/teichoic acid export membrane protein
MSLIPLPGQAPTTIMEPVREEAHNAGGLRVFSEARLGKLGYSLADQVLAVGGMFVVNIALARVRSKEEYGFFALSYSFFTFLAGLHNAAILEAYTIYGSGRYHGRFAKYRRLLWRSNAWLLTGLTVLLLTIWAGLRWLRPEFASPALLGMALTCGVLLTAAFIRRTFYIRRRPDLALRFSAAFFVSCVVLLALAIRANLLNGLSAFLIVSLAWVVAAVFVAGEHPGSVRPPDEEDFLHEEPAYWSEHWKYSRWVFVTALVFQFTTQAYFWVVAALLSVKDVAELRALYNLSLPVDQVFGAITLLVLPQMAFHFADDELGKLRRLWRQCSLMFIGISSVFALIVGLGSLRLLHLVYGGKFDDVAPLLPWFVLLPVVMGIGNAANAALKAMERPQAVFYAYLTSGAATFVLGIPLVMRLGLRGAVYGMLASTTAYTLAMFSGCAKALWLRNGGTDSSRTPLRLAIIEPAWTNYRYEVYRELSEHCHVDWIYSPVADETGYGAITPSSTPSLRYLEMPMRRLLGEGLGFWQVGVTRYLCRERPDIVMFDSNPRSITFWTTLICGRILGIPVYAHGHGVYKKTRISRPYRWMTALLLRLCTGYIAYAPIVREAFAKRGFSVSKVHVADNSIVNSFPLRPEEKTGTERGILFLGRLRPGCGLEILIETMCRLRLEDHLNLELHVIGGGRDEMRFRSETGNKEWIHWYGEIYDHAQIREISRFCLAGCYPGNAGLSVVHMMSLSLPVVVHNVMALHQGPEPGFVVGGRDGFLYDHAQPRQGIYQALRTLVLDGALRRRMSIACAETYERVTTPSLAIRLWSVLRVSKLRSSRQLVLKATS